MAPNRTAIEPVAWLLLALGLLSGCSRGGASTNGSPDSTVRNSSAAAPDFVNEASGADRCTLLTDDEIDDAIGPHNAGTGDAGNMWGLQGCRWMSTAIPPSGWTDYIEVAVFRKDRESWAREQAEGEPVEGFVEGARYNPSSGNLWFNCAHGRFCVVSARIGSGPRRPQVARHLAELVQKRLQ